MTSVHRDSQLFEKDVSFSGPVYLPPASVTNGMIVNDANNRIDAEKIVHRPDLHYSQADGVDVVSETRVLRVCRGDGVIKQVAVRPGVAPDGGDKQYTVDVQKVADGSNVGTSLLTGVVTITSADTDHTRQLGTLIASPVLEDGEAILVVITVSGATGDQGQGLSVTIGYEEQSAS